MIGLRVGLGRAFPNGTTLTLALVDPTDPVVGGANEAYTVQVTNTGSLAADFVTVDVQLDPTLTYVSASGTGWTFAHNGQSVRATRPTLAVGAAPLITVTATAAATVASIRTRAQVSAMNAGPVTSTADTTVSITTLSVAIIDTTDPIAHTADEVFTTTVTNTGLTNAAASVSVVITLDARFTYVSSTGTGWTITPVGQVVTCTRATLAANTAAPNVVIHATAGAAGSATTTAAASAANAVEADASQATTIT